ncbi:MAG: tetratricopeptide repeat protein [Acidobacteriota bacterium]
MSEHESGSSQLSDERLRELLQAVERPSSTADSACPDELTLVALADGRLSETERTRLDEHVAACPACALSLDVVDDDALRSPPRPAATALLGRLTDALLDFLTPEMPSGLAFAGRGSRGRPQPELETALLAYREERFDEAREGFEATLAGGGKTDPALHFFLGSCLLHEGETASARDHLAQAVKARPRLGEQRWHLARAELTLGRLTEASEELARCAQLPGPHREQARDLHVELERLRSDEDARP